MQFVGGASRTRAGAQAPDLDARRDQFTQAAPDLAESEGRRAVTMRRLAGRLGVTQPVLYSAFAGRQALIDAVALSGFGDIAAALEAVDASPAYLGFAAAHPRTYEAMFSLPSGLTFAADDTPEPLQRAFAGALQAGRRLRPAQAEARLVLAHRVLTARGS